uniref:fish-egg lectin-like n=1 Tax=Gasterosteus aculeatus aculeatus TaxID=481459 RepID=UPI001A99834A|nr:fish-egg lectin-like [Gasterosteus aculeatus aculeatus]
MKGVVAFLLGIGYLAITDAASAPWHPGAEAPRLNNVLQVDAGLGKVVVRDAHSNAYFLTGLNWNRLSTIRLKHVTVGPAGLWGVGINNKVHKYVAGTFKPSTGLSMLQVDAGHDQVVGVSPSSIAYCLNSRITLSYRGVGSLSWRSLSRRLKYSSCGPLGCWGVDTNDRVLFTQNVKPSTCSPSGWRMLPGSLTMIEVGTDGRVFGVNKQGNVYERTGISTARPFGLNWVHIPMCMAMRHVSYDLGKPWVVSKSGLIMHCSS